MSIFGALCFVFSGCCPKPLIMPDAAYRANIVAENPPLVLAREEKRKINVKVKNAGEANWLTIGREETWLTRGEDESEYRINLGNHWLDENEKLFLNDDGRVRLPDTVKPGETVTVSLEINAPQSAGAYVLELDLVQENVTWFAQKGSESVRYKIKVE